MRLAPQRHVKWFETYVFFMHISFLYFFRSTLIKLTEMKYKWIDLSPWQELAKYFEKFRYFDFLFPIQLVQFFLTFWSLEIHFEMADFFGQIIIFSWYFVFLKKCRFFQLVAKKIRILILIEQNCTNQRFELNSMDVMQKQENRSSTKIYFQIHKCIISLYLNFEGSRRKTAYGKCQT